MSTGLVCSECSVCVISFISLSRILDMLRFVKVLGNTPAKDVRHMSAS